MRALILLGFVLLFGYAAGAPALSCTGVNPQLLHDGHGYQIQTPMIDGANNVDAHVEIDGHRDIYNVRLIPSPTQAGTWELPTAIQGHDETAPISFHLTYMSDSRSACDTVQFGAHGVNRERAPAAQPLPEAAPAPEAAAPEATPNTPAACSLPIEHQVMKNDDGSFYITVMSREPFNYVELHATIGTSPETTIPIARNVATAQSPPMTIPTGEALTYFLTYAIGDVTCTTGTYQTAPNE